MDLADETWSVRMPTASDAESVGATHLRAWHETYPDIELGIDGAWIEQNVAHVNTPEGAAFRAALFAQQRSRPEEVLYLVVEAAGTIVGFLHAEVESEGTVTLEALYLLDTLKGSGAADEMTTRLFMWAGTRAINLDVASYNARAIRFYERHGFRMIPGGQLWRGRVPLQTMRRDVGAY